ncbi:purine-nucleoside phosphorylase [Aliifodinibius salicampi]|uniref:Purine nucleoside phosphorylase n=1 Tax=Fodinibius salicampi TaxID=1920655 RepID=A0ABT3PU29_9BACT|nr:purine-nucleoside phosphorylase [Fodinibius salicampi]MCW9711343.1 purine-nucleoside phosphorylase [Fodinibius salicampi]
MELPDFTDEIIHYLKQKELPSNIEAAVILGSGLGTFTDHIENPFLVSYEDIPSMPVSSVEGHDGKLIIGKINDHPIIAFSGRFHHYEGFSFEQTATPVYISKALDVNKLIISNAAGAINTSFSVGDLMVIEDVIRNNLSIAPRGRKQHRYLHHQYVNRIRKIASDLGLITQQGTYMYVTGPNYETKAEIRAFRTMGADAVGMSTTTELFEAARLELKSAAISLITNMSTGVTGDKLDHKEVKATADARKEDFARVVKALIQKF